jgi:hypothetical protein
VNTKPPGLTRYGTFLLGFLAISCIQAVQGQIPQSGQHEIDRIIGAKGIYIPEERVYKLTLPREAATLVLDYQALPPTMGLNSWAAFSSARHHGALFTGQVLLLEDEVDPIVAAALKSHLEVTGLADSSFFDGPTVKTLDISGVGTYEHLASAFRTVLDEIHRRVAAKALRDAPLHRPTLSLDSSITLGPIDQILSMHGVLSNGVYRAAIGQRGTIYGEEAGRELGLSTWISISGTDKQALAHGEIIAAAGDLQTVVRALESGNFHLVSIRNHMVGEHPSFYFVRYWREGRAAELAQSFRSVLEAQIGSEEENREAVVASRIDE